MNCQLLIGVLLLVVCSSSAAQVRPSKPISMTITADSATIATEHQLQFNVHFSDVKSRRVIWKVNDKEGGESSKTVGTIDPSGLYTAPSDVPDKPSPTVKISATLLEDSNTSSSVSLTITSSSCPPSSNPPSNRLTPCLYIEPYSQLVRVGRHSQQLSAHTGNGTGGAVTWEIKCPSNWVNCSDSPDKAHLGSIDPHTGEYTAPPMVPSEMVEVTAKANGGVEATTELVIVRPEISVKCSSSPAAQHVGCKVIDFDRLAPPNGKVGDHEVTDNEDVGLVTAITSSKAIFSGSILSIDFSEETGVNKNNCKNYDWKLVVQAKESPTALIYGPGDVGAGVCSSAKYLIALPVHVLWADVHAFPQFPDPSRSVPSDPSTYTDCFGQYAPQSIFPCDRDSRWPLRLLYKTGWLYNHLTPPGTAQATISLTPVIGTGQKQLSFDILANYNYKLGPGWLSLPLTFEKSTAEGSNLDALIIGLAYDFRSLTRPNLSEYSHFILRKPQLQIRSGPEIAPTTPHDVNLVESETIKFPLVFSFQQQPSAFTVYPLMGVEEGSHFVTHLIENRGILRGFAGVEGSFRWPYNWTHNFFGSSPLTVEYSYRMRWLASDEPTTDVADNGVELLSHQRQSFFRSSLIAPMTQYISFETTVLHGSLPPDFRVLGTTLTFGLTITNPGSSEH
jgi:hypothetical protein